MAYPTTLDVFPSAPTLAAHDLDTDPHSGLHGNLGTAVAAIEAKVGVNSSAVTSSVDYIITNNVLLKADNLSGLANAATARTNLGLGTIATQNANNVTITGGSVTGITDLAVADGGTGASDAATARTNLGLVIGTNVQAFDADLSTIAGLTATTDNFMQSKSSAWASRTPTQAAVDIAPVLVASSIPIVDTGNFYTTDNVNAAFQEIGTGTPITALAGYSARVSLNTGVAAFAAATSETSWWTGTKFQLPAGPTVGDQYVFDAVGLSRQFSGVAQNHTFYLYLGSVNVGIQVANLTSDTTARPVHFQFFVTVISTGASGTVLCKTTGYVGDTAVGLNMAIPGATGLKAYGESIGPGSQTVTTIDTTAARDFDFRSKSGAATATQTMTPQLMTIDKINAP